MEQDEETASSCGGSVDSSFGGAIPKRSRNLIADVSPLHHELQRNKESLKVKLMVRRPMTALVEQGILPSPKTSPALHEQRTKLERAKMGDMLRAKIAKRPDRQELVHRHILEDVRPGVDPSLCERQMQLKRAKLADTLSNQLSHRPGPLELIKKNILHTEDDSVEQAVKQGQITFTPTNEGLRTFLSSLEPDEDSNSEGSPQSASGGQSPPPPPPPPPPPQPPNYLSSLSTSSSPKQIFIVPKSYSQRSAPGKDHTVRKKKSKSKGAVGNKQRTIKFHEYKGPPSTSRKFLSDKLSDGDYTAYDLLLQQQQLYLQWQLQTQQQKYQQLILPATTSITSTKSSVIGSGLGKGSPNSQTPRSTTPNRIVSNSLQAQQEVNDAIHMLARLDDMKVNDLKAELKKRNLTISGPKPLLIDRLKPHLEAVVVNARHLNKGLRENSPVVVQSPSSPALSAMDLGSAPSSPFVITTDTTNMETDTLTPTVIHSKTVPSSPSPPPAPPPPPPPPPSRKKGSTGIVLPQSPLPVSQLRLIIHQAPPPPQEDTETSQIIESQRKKIEELQMALEMSQSQLELQRLQQQNVQQLQNVTNSEIVDKNINNINPVIKSSSLPNFNQDLTKMIGNELVLNEYSSTLGFNSNNKNVININNNQNNFSGPMKAMNTEDQFPASASLDCDNFNLPGDDVLDLLLRTQGNPSLESQDTGIDSSSDQQFSTGKSPASLCGEIPNPPPLPKTQSSSTFQPFSSNNIDFSSLDLSDLPFDAIPEELVNSNDNKHTIMDVDQDVGDWLDSLLPSPGIAPENNDNKTNNSINYGHFKELNGNIIGFNDEDIWG
uniref:SAP domain-containing protein n=1 Tax=Lepeophtheirus salmonis TaxID=72036 RepID=A0A0K2T2A6_LEPSM